MLEASDTQIVAVDTNKTLKFYEFIDKVKKEEEEKKVAEEEKLHRGIKEMFERYDVDKSGRLSFDEFSVFITEYFQSIGYDWMVNESDYKQIFTSFD